MNYFVLANGIIYVAATMYSASKGHYLLGLVWLCYAVSAFAMCAMEGSK